MIKPTVFSALREHEVFFALFQRETLSVSLSNQPVVYKINYLQQNPFLLTLLLFLLILRVNVLEAATGGAV